MESIFFRFTINKLLLHIRISESESESGSMYPNCEIVHPTKTHLITFIMLHPMQCDATYFADLVNCFAQDPLYSDTIKFIFPNAPTINIDYPGNPLLHVKSWYNYYTCNNGIDKLDEIDESQLDEQTNLIVKIVKTEAKLLGNYRNIFLGGVSQGGTLIFNILYKLQESIGGLFYIKSIYMDNDLKSTRYNKIQKTPIYIYSGANDEIYSLAFQKKCFKKLSRLGFTIDWLVIPNLDHFSKIKDENMFIIERILNR